MVPHLNSCQKQPQDVRMQAHALCIERGWIRGPKPQVSLNIPQFSGVGVGLPQPAYSQPSFPSNSTSSTSCASAQNFLLPPTFPIQPSTLSPAGDMQRLPSPLLFAGSPGPDTLGGFHGLGDLTDPSSRSQSPSLVSLPTVSTIQSRTGSPALGELSRPSSKRIRVLSQTRSSTPDMSAVVGGTSSRLQWTPAFQERFETHMANITASCGLSLNWIENQAVRNFINEFFPLANPISSYQLANRVIPREVEKFRQAAKNRCHGSHSTLQTDGWTGINFRYLLAFMITTSNREAS
jgi:hypothetical protein